MVIGFNGDKITIREEFVTPDIGSEVSQIYPDTKKMNFPMKLGQWMHLQFNQKLQDGVRLLIIITYKKVTSLYFSKKISEGPIVDPEKYQG